VIPCGVALQAGQFLLFTDGGAHSSNQSGCRVLHPAGAGWVIYQVDDPSSSPPSLSLVQFGGAWLGQSSHNTNNIAEYNALLWGLHRACELGVKHLAAVCDSQVVVRQVTGQCRVKCPHLIPLKNKVVEFTQGGQFESIDIAWSPREGNTTADQLANLAITF